MWFLTPRKSRSTHSIRRSRFHRPRLEVLEDRLAPAVATWTGNGGDLSCNNGNGCGTIFKLSPKSKNGFTFSLTYAFDGATGANPTAGVIVDAAENLYETTFAGGTGNCELTGCGVAFAVVP